MCCALWKLTFLCLYVLGHKPDGAYYANDDGQETSYDHQQSPLIENDRRPRNDGDEDDDSNSYSRRRRYEDDRDSEHSFNMGHDNRQYK